jgi:hypothetical protein
MYFRHVFDREIISWLSLPLPGYPGSVRLVEECLMAQIVRRGGDE